MKKYRKSSVKGKLDALVGGHFRSRPCDHCGRSPACWAHIKSRRYLSTRWLPMNAFSLCASCHKWAHDQPDAFTRWIEKDRPGRLDTLNSLFKDVMPWKQSQLEELYDRLKQELQ
jgi:5-methylcytosine-specific restriction endonuclease McrA